MTTRYDVNLISNQLTRMIPIRVINDIPAVLPLLDITNGFFTDRKDAAINGKLWEFTNYESLAKNAVSRYYLYSTTKPYIFEINAFAMGSSGIVEVELWENSSLVGTEVPEDPGLINVDRNNHRTDTSYVEVGELTSGGTGGQKLLDYAVSAGAVNSYWFTAAVSYSYRIILTNLTPKATRITFRVSVMEQLDYPGIT